MREEEKIREELSQVLKNEPENYSKILALSSKLSTFDKDNVRFSVDAGVIDRLGNELVARQETAVSELVKNSYDADAVKVSLTFTDATELGGKLTIMDDGDGMSREQLINGFMRISSTDKMRNPFSEGYKRQRAGRKGIGRFAVQRLGERLTIITQTENSDDALVLTINWLDYKGDVDLFSIENSIQVISPKKRLKGTSLIIDGLKDKWTEASIKRVYRYVSEIIQPFPLSLQDEAIESSEQPKDPGFKTIFYVVEREKPAKKVGDEQIMIYDHATATISGDIDENGYGSMSVESSILDFDFEDIIGVSAEEKESRFTKIRNIRFKAYYFIYASNLIPKMHESAIRKLANLSGGIRLYRNGFRVLPYGEPGDDWVSLDLSTRRRSLLPVHANINFFGFVELNDSSGNFDETSSREGLMENPAFVELQNFVYRTIATGVIKIAEYRNIKIVSNQKKDEEGNWEKMEFRVRNIAHTLEELDKAIENQSDAVVSKRKKQLDKLKKQLKEVSELQKEERSKMLKERSMLRVLSSVGLTVGQFIHEIKYYLDNIHQDIKVLIEDLSENLEALSRLEILDNNFSVFKTYMSYFDNVISQNVIRELRPIELRTAVRPFVESLEDDARKSGIEFAAPIFHQYGLYSKPMHPSEWSSILFNFYTNSKKAIKKKSNEGQIQIECGKDDKYIYLEFSDTGIGIDKDSEEKIFDEFYTTTSQANLDNLDMNTEILGTGLGLKIVKDIISSYKGSIRVVSPKSHFSTCLRVEIPLATEKELNEYGL